MALKISLSDLHLVQELNVNLVLDEKLCEHVHDFLLVFRFSLVQQRMYSQALHL